MVRPVQILDSGGPGSNPSLVRHYFSDPVTCGTLGLTAWQDSKYIQLKGISSHYNSHKLFDIMHSLCTELYIKSKLFSVWIQMKNLELPPLYHLCPYSPWRLVHLWYYESVCLWLELTCNIIHHNFWEIFCQNQSYFIWLMQIWHT